MKNYKALKGLGLYVILAFTIICDLILFTVLNLIDSYVLSMLLKASIIMYNAYQVYYILLSISIRYVIDGNKLCIVGIWGLKKININLEKVEKFSIDKGRINGVKLSGYGSNSFALGKVVLNKIGLASMFVTNSKSIFYIKHEDTVYGISPAADDNFKKVLISFNIQEGELHVDNVKEVNLHKDKRFMIPLILVTVVILVLTINPFILYLKDKLPGDMPLNFDSAFIPVERGTGKQFAFGQMIYGVLNMAILFCMYYASYFYAKYDKRSSHKFIYVSLIIAVVFLIMQFRILLKFT